MPERLSPHITLIIPYFLTKFHTDIYHNDLKILHGNLDHCCLYMCKYMYIMYPTHSKYMETSIMSCVIEYLLNPVNGKTTKTKPYGGTVSPVIKNAQKPESSVL